MNISQQHLKSVINYEPTTGQFRWAKTTGPRSKIGDIAGHTKKNKRVVIAIDGVIYQAHRLAWLYVYARPPINEIDHINGDPSDNRISNLRDVTRAHNQMNIRKPHKDNKSGYLGVSKDGDKWAATIRFDGKTQYIGSFSSPELAHKAYVSAKRKHHASCTI